LIFINIKEKEIKMPSTTNFAALSNGEYEDLSLADRQDLQRQILWIRDRYPDCAIVGGAALRILCPQNGIPVPRIYGGDVDIILPQERRFRRRIIDGKTVDVFPSDFPLLKPYFTKFELAGRELTLSSPSRMLAFKARGIVEGFEDRGNVLEKDIVYFSILRKLATQQELSKFLKFSGNARIGGKSIPGLLQSAGEIIDRAMKEGLISQETRANPYEKDGIKEVMPGCLEGRRAYYSAVTFG
jgi:hypothetical protein